MACYCDQSVRYRGRLIIVHWRYCSFMSYEGVKGKPLPHPTKRDLRKIARLGDRAHIPCRQNEDDDED